MPGDANGDMRLEGTILTFQGQLVKSTVPGLLAQVESLIEDWICAELVIDLKDVTRIDSAGVVFLKMVRQRLKDHGMTGVFRHETNRVRKAMDTFQLEKASEGASRAGEIYPWRLLESLGQRVHRWFEDAMRFFYLMVDALYFSVQGIMNKAGMRKGEYLNQCMLIGMNALPIVGLISFLIGFILALQSAYQLRQFGASIFVADLVSISMTREMGPLMTAVILAGRSGSAIASEIATMVVTEEIDALKSMGLNPLRYVLVPKIHAIVTVTPMLTVLSILLGILGALVIGISYLEIGVEPFYNQVLSALFLKDIVTGMVKSLIFALIIVIVSAFCGFQVKGGAEGVGRATTASVVASIFFVILADSILGLIFYFGQELPI